MSIFFRYGDAQATPCLNYILILAVDNNDESFLQNGWSMEGVKPYFQPGPLVLTITKLQYATASNFWTHAKFNIRAYSRFLLKWYEEGLTQKGRVDVSGEKAAQISIATNNIDT